MFWPLQLNSEISGVPEDSQVPISGVWVLSSQSLKVGLRQSQSLKICMCIWKLRLWVEVLDEFFNVNWIFIYQLNLGPFINFKKLDEISFKKFVVFVFLVINA